MAAELVEPPGSRSFKDASPREVRAALIPEEQPDFDQQWRAALLEAADSLDLTPVHAILTHWRRHATLTTQLGHDSYRQMLADAADTLRTGDRTPDSVPWSQLKVELGL